MTAGPRDTAHVFFYRSFTEKHVNNVRIFKRDTREMFDRWRFASGVFFLLSASDWGLFTVNCWTEEFNLKYAVVISSDYLVKSVCDL